MMVFAIGLFCLGGGGLLAVATDLASAVSKRNDTIAGLLLVIGLSLIGGGLGMVR